MLENFLSSDMGLRYPTIGYVSRSCHTFLSQTSAIIQSSLCTEALKAKVVHGY